MKKRVFNFLLIFIFIATIFSGLVPAAYVQAAPLNQVEIAAKAAISIDVKTGEIIYAKGIDNKMYPASTTKILTALLLAENKKKTDLIPYTQSAKSQPAYSLSTNIMRPIKIGDTMSADDVMKALLLFSANDSAYMIADAVAGNVDNFGKMMNDKAASLGAKNSHFITPNGLHDDNHYTTAYDLSVLARASFTNPWVKETIGLKQSKISTTSGLNAPVDNRNELLGKNGNLGGKTGFTNEAGRCLISLYERDGRQLIGIVMNSTKDSISPQVFKDMEAMIDWSYKAERSTAYKNGDTLKTEAITYKAFRFFGPEKTIEVPVIIKDEVKYYENEVNKAELKPEITIANINPWKLSADSKIGKVDFKQREYSESYDLYTTVTSKDLMDANKGLYLTLGLGIIVGIIVIALLFFMISRGFSGGKRKNRYR